MCECVPNGGHQRERERECSGTVVADCLTWLRVEPAVVVMVPSLLLLLLLQSPFKSELSNLSLSLSLSQPFSLAGDLLGLLALFSD